MRPEQIDTYLKDDFRTELNIINKVSVYSSFDNKSISGFEHIPHHRYSLLFNPITREIRIHPTEGGLRTDHIRIETELISYITKNKTVFENNTTHPTQLVLSWLERVKKDMGDKKLKGILIGSIWNFNFFIKRKLGGDFGQFASSVRGPSAMEQYINHQLNLILLEQEYLQGGLLLTESEKDIFSEGGLPTQEEVSMSSDISKRISDFKKKMCDLKEDKDLLEYISTDYLFFNDIENGTNEFKETIEGNRATIIDDPFISYQIIDTGCGFYLNFSWVSAEILQHAVKGISNMYDIEELHMYGKCGSLSEKYRVGDFAYPTILFDEKGLVKFKNELWNRPQLEGAAFVSVISPLIETRKWAADMIEKGCECVEMELSSVLSSVKPETKKFIVYYVSDQPLAGHTLSSRLGLLKQRLSCSKKIINAIFEARNQ